MSFSWVTTFWSFGFFWIAATCYDTEGAGYRDSAPAVVNATNVDNDNEEGAGEMEWGVYAVNFINNSRDPYNIVVTVWCLSIACCHIW
jgi:hypothetical protein